MPVIVGVDEVGRGAVAGPMYLGAVVLTPTNPLFKTLTTQEENLNLLLNEEEKIILRDSKKMTFKQRLKTAAFLQRQITSFLVGIDNQYIDNFGLTKALEQGINQLLAEISRTFSLSQLHLLVDGNFLPHLKYQPARAENIIKGDNQLGIIAAAAVIAKVHRDNLMIKLSSSYPQYHWQKNVGYGTPQHLEAIRLHGLTSYHRRSFLNNFLAG